MKIGKVYKPLLSATMSEPKVALSRMKLHIPSQSYENCATSIHDIDLSHRCLQVKFRLSIVIA